MSKPVAEPAAKPTGPKAPGGGLDQSLAALGTSRAQRQVCRLLGVDTVAEFLATPKSKFLAVRGGSERTYAAIERRVAKHLHAVSAGPAQNGSDRPITGLLLDSGAERAFLALGITTVGQFLAAPKETLLAVAGFNEAAYRKVVDRIRSTAPVRSAMFELLPESLLEFPVARLALPQPLVRQLHDIGCDTLGGVLALPEAQLVGDDGLGAEATAQIRTCLDQLFRIALTQVDAVAVSGELDWATLKGRLLAPLPDEDRELIGQLIGLDSAPRTLSEIALSRGRNLHELAEAADIARCRLHDRAPSILCRMRYEIARELDAFEGLVTGEHFATGTLAHTMARATGDQALPLRLLGFCFPNDFHLLDNCLSAMHPRLFRRFLRRLRTLTSPARLPLALEQLADELRVVIDPVPRGLLLHLLRNALGLSLHIDGERGEFVMPSTESVPVRLRGILQDEGKPQSLVDLVFHYRDRYRTASQSRILTHLRADRTFLEIGPQLWSLRSWHDDELAEVATLAETVISKVCDQVDRRHVRALFPQPDPGDRVYYLVLDRVRSDERVRYLGRGEFCAAQRQRSAAMEQLLKDFRRAGGDVVLSRFLENQPPERRRLVGRLLLWNRHFLQPAPDRIDVLTNYPFNDERLQRLVDVVGDWLDSRGGHAPIDSVLAEVNRTDLGGSWLNTTIFGEVLRRHGVFELLPSGIVARADLMLVSRLLAKARAALRRALVPLTVQELVAHQPELAEFEACLQDLLPRDPMLQSRDGQRWQVA
jgi:hypothetical protein